MNMMLEDGKITRVVQQNRENVSKYYNQCNFHQNSHKNRKEILKY